MPNLGNVPARYPPGCRWMVHRDRSALPTADSQLEHRPVTRSPVIERHRPRSRPHGLLDRHRRTETLARGGGHADAVLPQTPCRTQ